MATKARLHWFWHGMLAVLAGIAVFATMAATLNPVVHPVYSSMRSWLRHMGIMSPMDEIIGITVCMLTPSLIAAIAVHGIMRRQGEMADNETHCRKCNHILRGISEPRCPECGEVI